MHAWAEKYYGSLPAHVVPRRKPREEPAQAVCVAEFKAPAEQSYVALAFKVPGFPAAALDAAKPDASSDDALR